MDIITALAVVIGIMGGAATWLVLGPLGGLGLLIWAIFIGWGSFYHCGGKEAGLKNAAICGVWGVICAAAALMLVTSLAGALGVPLAAGVLVGITVVVLILGAKTPLLAAIPASVYGYASTAAFVLHSGVDLAVPGAVVKAAVMVAISIVVGAVLGFISEKIAGAIVAKAPATVK